MTFALALGWALAGGLAGLAFALNRRLELVAQAEHELRGPLGALALGARLDNDDSLARVRLALDDLSAARRGGRVHRAGDLVALDGLVRSAAAEAAPAARVAGGALSLDWRAGPVTVWADEGRLLQALANVLANAVEHGGAVIEMEGERTASGVRVEVRDAGPGFRRAFWPVRRSAARGRGLQIAKRAVREAGGHLRVESRAPGGRLGVALRLVDEAAGRAGARSGRPGACVVLEMPIAGQLLPAQLSLVETEAAEARTEALVPS